MAGRIPQAFIDDLLERVDIVEVIDRRVPLKKSGRNYSARCPFHDEKTPSFSVSPDKQFFYCFGCGAGGNAIGFVMDYDRVDFPQAVATLATLAGLEVPREAQPERVVQQQKQQRDLYQILDAAARFYREQLRRHPQAKRAVEYLKKRGVTGEIARDFGIGYAPPGWDNLLQALAKNEHERKLLIDAGMLVIKDEDNKCYDRFRDRVMFPILDSRGRVIAFGGRVLNDEKPKYLNSPETPIFHKGRELYGLYQARKAVRHLQRLVVVEGYMDVVALAQFGIPYAVATLGTATSTEHLQKVFRQCSEVIFCFDGDNAGRQAARRALEATLPAMEDGRSAKFLFLPEGEDPDSLVRKEGAAAFEQLLNNAQSLADYLFDCAGEGLNPNSLEDRARLSKLATPLIAKVPAGVFKQLLIDALAQRTGLSSEKLTALTVEVEKVTPPASQSVAHAAPMQRRPLPPRTEIQRNPVLYAIGLLLLHPQLARHAPAASQLTHLEGETGTLLRDLIELLQRRPEANTNVLLGHWYDQPWRQHVETAFNQVGILLENVEQLNLAQEEGVERELAETLRRLEQSQIEAQINALLSKANELTPQEKQQYRQLLSQKHNK
ncbi:MAG TPA: DNA primase [Spongiibacteraceae bacterium]|nr:DNA primase [Spongiibacteraceae bacterium]